MEIYRKNKVLPKGIPAIEGGLCVVMHVLRRWKAVALLTLFTIVLLVGCGRANSKQPHEKLESTAALEQVEITFPYQIPDQELEIESLFQYSGLNPDCADEEGEEIGAIQVVNRSKNYLETAQITILMADGTKLVFQIEDLPAGSSVMAFDINNTTFAEQQPAAEIIADIHYAEESSLHEDEVAVTIQDGAIHLHNQSGNAIQKMEIRYHCEIDGIYFGGKSFAKQVDLLEAGEDTTVSTEECYFGEAAVTKIRY